MELMTLFIHFPNLGTQYLKFLFVLQRFMIWKQTPKKEQCIMSGTTPQATSKLGIRNSEVGTSTHMTGATSTSLKACSSLEF